MSKAASAAFGLWRSPISPESISHAIRIEDVGWNRSGDVLVWLERRAGKGVLVARRLDELCDQDLTEEHRAGAAVGYGGGTFVVGSDAVYYVEKDGRIYRRSLAGGAPEALTPAFGRCASPALSPDERWLLYVHQAGEDCLALCPTSGLEWPTRLAQGADFYMQPRWHPSGSSVAWVEWNHPQMPWDGSQLIFATLTFEGDVCTAKQSQRIAGGSDCATAQPEFSADGQSLFFVSDDQGWSQIYRYDLTTCTAHRLTPQEREYAPPAWAQGMRSYAVAPDDSCLYAIENHVSSQRLMRLDLGDGALREVRAFSSYRDLTAPAVSAGGQIAVIGSSPVCAARLLMTLPAGTAPAVMRRTTAERLSAEDLVQPEHIQLPSAEGSKIYGWLYRDKRIKPSGTEGLPPAVISIHGGPTSQAGAGFSARAQFFATRGYIYLDLNYRGSSGYGRAYREALNGHWGVRDVEDAVAGARYLGRQGIADVGRIVIVGGSAGGFTVLKALADSPGVFAAGICLYGVFNLLALAEETHKFEAHYLDSLIGPLPAAAAIYRERSPLYLVDRIQDPIALFQGSEDKVVPLGQAEEMVESLRRRGAAFEYYLYQGEEHGWRLPETIKRHYRDMERFLRKYVLLK